MCGQFLVLPNFSGRFPVEYLSYHFRIHVSSSRVLRRSQQLCRIFQPELCHLLDLGAGMTQSYRNHLDALSWCFTFTAGADTVAKCVDIFLCENYKNDSENIPSICSPLSLPHLKKVFTSFYGNK